MLQEVRERQAKIVFHMVSSLVTYYVALQNFPFLDQEPQTTSHLPTAPKLPQTDVCRWERPSGSAHLMDDSASWKCGKDAIGAVHTVPQKLPAGTIQ